jgi:hypothetical protein
MTNPVECTHCGLGPNGSCDACGAPLPDTPLPVIKARHCEIDYHNPAAGGVSPGI